MLKLKSKIDNENIIVTEDSLRDSWEEEIFDMARNEKITMKEMKRQYTFEQFIADLLGTGEYEIVKDEKESKYLVGVMVMMNGEYVFSIYNTIFDNFDGLKDNVNKELERLSNTDEFGRVFMAFGGKYIEEDKDGCVAEYYIQEMRTNTLVVKYKVYRIEI